jgi:hypothetical protein
LLPTSHPPDAGDLLVYSGFLGRPDAKMLEKVDAAEDPGVEEEKTSKKGSLGKLFFFFIHLFILFYFILFLFICLLVLRLGFA